MAYDTPAALRQALEARLVQQAHEQRLDLGRLRRRVVFERILVRLDAAVPGAWVLKGGMALETRLGGRARSTRDLDLAVRDRAVGAARLRERLIATLALDPDRDGFTFAVGEPESLGLDEAVGGGTRFSVRANMAGREFATVRVDVASRPDEVTDTERLPLPGVFAFAGRATRSFETVSPNQQFAEKLHALTRDYGDRDNTRTRDLVDLLLLIEHDLLDPPALAGVVARLFALRGTHAVPDAIPDVPPSWEAPYARLAAELNLGARTLPDALQRLRRFWTDLARTSRR